MIHTPKFFHPRSAKSSFQAAFHRPHLPNSEKISALFYSFSLKKILRTTGILAVAFVFGSLASRVTSHFRRLPLMLSRSRNSTLAAPLPALSQGLLPGLPQTLLLRKMFPSAFPWLTPILPPWTVFFCPVRTGA